MGLAETQAAFAAALLDPTQPAPRGVVSPRGEADAKRFAVYRNNVFVGLTSALAKRFPVTQALVGQDFFAGMARIFAGLERPASPLMFEYGDGFPDFIANFEPAKGLAYLADVARVEAAWTRAYHAADVEPIAPAALAAIDPARLPEARLAAHPAADLVASSFPVGSIWAAHQTPDVSQARAQGAETVLVARPGLDVAVHVLPRRDAPFAQQLFAGATLGAAAQAALDADGDFDFGAALIGLTGLGGFSAIEMEES